jgi:FAD/FMN-containing dehydrogenase
MRAAEGFIAVDGETRKKFWLDRSRTAAISRHTNAFKVNEDVVIPLPRMGDYCDGIERINIELSTQNKLALCDALAEFLKGELPLHAGDANLDKDVLIGDRRASGAGLRRSAVRLRWEWLLDNLDLPLAEAEVAALLPTAWLPES